tara:strand:+ start:277 stop:444 length:168 start_codon:yes stop_codon:yes gene_type:complete
MPLMFLPWLLNNDLAIDKMSHDAREVASKSYTLERKVKEIDELIKMLMLEGSSMQ